MPAFEGTNDIFVRKLLHQSKIAHVKDTILSERYKKCECGTTDKLVNVLQPEVRE